MNAEDNTKDRILQAALDLFWSRSVGSVSMDMVCKRASVSKSSLYHFFASKSDLVVETYAFHWSRVARDYAEVFTADRSGEDQLKAYVDITLRDMATQQIECGCVIGCPYVLGAAEMSTLDERVRTTIEGIFERIISLIERAVIAGCEAGTFTVANPREAAHDIYTMMTGAVLQSRARNAPREISSVWPIMRARLA